MDGSIETARLKIIICRYCEQQDSTVATTTTIVGLDASMEVLSNLYPEIKENVVKGIAAN